MRTSQKADTRKLKITLVSTTYQNQRLQYPSLSPHVLLNQYKILKLIGCETVGNDLCNHIKMITNSLNLCIENEELATNSLALSRRG